MVKPKIAETEMEKLQKQSDAYDEQIKNLTQDAMNKAPLVELEPQTKLSSKEIEKSNKIWLKPSRTINDGQKFNEKWREEYNFAIEYVQFIAEHKELEGDTIDIWTHEFGGMGAQYWQVPTNKPVWGPRYLAERIRNCRYHRLKTEDSRITRSDGMGSYYGALIVDTTIPRLTCESVSSKKSVFMGEAA
jgi:hypothetical protein